MLAKVRSLFRNLFRKGRVERDLDDELAAFDELSAVDRTATKDEVRATRAGALVDQLGQDLRHGARALLRTPGFTLVAIATLALGIGANTAIFSVVDGVLLRPAPVEDLDGLVMVWETDRNSGTTREPASLPDFLDFRAQSRSFTSLAAVMAGEVNLATAAGEPRRVGGLQVAGELLPMLGVRPIVGRGLGAGDARPGGPRVAVISEGLWREAFGRSPDVVGKTLRLDEVTYEVAGVIGDDSDFGVLQILSAAAYSRSFADRGGRGDVDVWTPLVADPERLPRATHPIFVLGRLLPGRSLPDARAELAGIAADLERAFPENDGRGVFLEPLADVVFAPVRPALRLLLGTVFLVLLIASVNVANLLLARGASRTREVAVRTALGATRGRLTRQFLVENLLLTLTAAAVGVGLAYLGLDALIAIAPADVPRLASASVDLRVLLFTLVTSVVVGLIFGLVPSLQARRVDVQAALKAEGGAVTSSTTRRRLGASLVVVELGLAVLLVAGASLLVRSFWKLGGVDPGFRAEGVLKAEYQLPAARYPANFKTWPDFKEMHAFTAALLARVSALPGVQAAAVAGDHPLDPGFTNSFVIVGREAEARSWPEISMRRVTPGYFATVGLPLVRGRALEASDGTAGEPVLLINQAAADRFFPRPRRRSARVTDPDLGHQPPRRRRRRQREVPRPRRGGAGRRLHPDGADAVGRRRRRAARPRHRRSGRARGGGARHHPRARRPARRLRRRGPSIARWRARSSSGASSCCSWCSSPPSPSASPPSACTASSPTAWRSEGARSASAWRSGRAAAPCSARSSPAVSGWPSPAWPSASPAPPRSRTCSAACSSASSPPTSRPSSSSARS
jgi:predicted permease